jgi:hypothetical protein
MVRTITFLFAEARSTTILPFGATGYRLGDEMEKKPSRQRVKKLQVPILPAEEVAIKRNAGNCGLTVAAYLRTLGLEYRPKTILDNNAVGELVKVNADLGRLGGLLKMLLTNDERLKAIGKEQIMPTINGILEEIKTTQSLLLAAAQKV